MAAVCPRNVYNDPNEWARVRRLDALALALVGGADPPNGAKTAADVLLTMLGCYRQAALADYAAARPLF